MKAPRVLVVTNMFPSAERPYFGIFVARQVEALEALGVETTVETIAAGRGEADYFLGRRRVRRTVRGFRPDVIHCHYGYTPLAVVGSGVPYVVTLCGDDLNGESNGQGGVTLKSRAGIEVTQAMSALARRVLVQSEAMRRALRPRARSLAEVLPNGVDAEAFAPGSRRAARAYLGVPDDRLVIGFVHSIRQPTKRLDIAQAVRDELERRGVATHLLVAESVPAAAMPWYYRAADCLLMTSDREGAPNCVKEALACGVPVVGRPVGDLPELIRDPAMGRVVASRDPARLADAIVSLDRGPDVRAPMLPAPFRSENIAARLVEIYRSIAGNSSGNTPVGSV
jgi:glycosyltransferase involved in cell wall biosynthesis